MERNMLKVRKLPKYFWGGVVSTSCFILNRSPTRSLQEITPEEAWSGRKPYVCLISRSLAPFAISIFQNK